jgi:hypothetical protein
VSELGRGALQTAFEVARALCHAFPFEGMVRRRFLGVAANLSELLCQGFLVRAVPRDSSPSDISPHPHGQLLRPAF